MKAINIIWDTDEENVLETLPKEIEIPKEIEDDEDRMSDYLSGITGFCHYGFEIID